MPCVVVATFVVVAARVRVVLATWVVVVSVISGVLVVVVVAAGVVVMLVIWVVVVSSKNNLSSLMGSQVDVHGFWVHALAVRVLGQAQCSSMQTTANTTLWQHRVLKNTTVHRVA